jgi:NAD(P)-dependent dehydrogenase (short-subunit alcohol dehydrogenase family)
MSSILGMVGVAQSCKLSALIAWPHSDRFLPADYNASKAALINLNDTLRYELDKRSDQIQ